jgi:hypothetical protein
VTEALNDQRTLIVLKDRLVDDGGDVVSVDAIGDVTGRDVLLRGQVDATFADLDAALFAVSGARHVYLAWGVGLDGDDVPVGVDPGIRIRARAVPPPNGEAPAPDPAGADVAPAQ